MYCRALEGIAPKTSTPPPMVFIAGQIQLMAEQALELAARHWGSDPPARAADAAFTPIILYIPLCRHIDRSHLHG